MEWLFYVLSGSHPQHDTHPTAQEEWQTLWLRETETMMKAAAFSRAFDGDLAEQSPEFSNESGHQWPTNQGKSAENYQEFTSKSW